MGFPAVWQPWAFQREPVVRSVVSWQSTAATSSGVQCPHQGHAPSGLPQPVPRTVKVPEQSHSCSNGKSLLWGSPSSWPRHSQSSRAVRVSSYPILPASLCFHIVKSPLGLWLSPPTPVLSPLFPSSVSRLKVESGVEPNVLPPHFLWVKVYYPMSRNMHRLQNHYN